MFNILLLNNIKIVQNKSRLKYEIKKRLYVDGDALL